jgi:glycerol-1-phosphate dehydrogenase [NAD(P)+]
MAGEDPRQIYGSTFACECGKTHSITPDEVVFADDAVQRLPDACARATRGRRAVLISDARTHEVAGAEVEAALGEAGWEIELLRLDDPAPGEDPVCDDLTHDALLPRVQGADLVVPVGSGVINDLGKWLANDIDVPFVTFATAASMNGYTSANVAPRIAGVKALVRARPPVAAFSRPRVIAEAPHAMTVSGLGDVLAKSVSSADWYMNHVLFGDYFCSRSVSLVGELEPLYFDDPEGIRDREEGAIAAMFDALMLTGVAMTMVGTSAPASGGEHLISHSLDMLSAVDGRPHDFHGRQVGIGTILTAELYRRAMEVESPELHELPAEVDRSLWGKLADEVAAKHAEKRERIQIARKKLGEGDTWDRLRQSLSGMLRPPEKIHACLKRAGGAVRAEDIKSDRERLRTVLVHGREIRPRFTILDLAYLLGLLPSAAAEIVEQWA